MKQISLIVILLLASCMILSANSPPFLNNTTEIQITALQVVCFADDFPMLLTGGVAIITVPEMQIVEVVSQSVVATARDWPISSLNYSYEIYNENTGQNMMVENHWSKLQELGHIAPEIVHAIWTKVMMV